MADYIVILVTIRILPPLNLYHLLHKTFLMRENRGWEYNVYAKEVTAINKKGVIITDLKSSSSLGVQKVRGRRGMEAANGRGGR